MLDVHAQNECARPKFIQKKYDYTIDRDKLIKRYADSINNISAKNDIPFFLSDECIEYDITLRRGYHSTESVRWSILKKVTNKNALRIILQSNTIHAKAHCERYMPGNEIKIEYSAMSFYDLLQKRFKGLK